MTYEEACHKWAIAKSNHFVDDHKPVGEVDFDISVSGCDTCGNLVMLDVTVNCSCDTKVRIEASPYDFNEILQEIVGYSKESNGSE